MRVVVGADERGEVEGGAGGVVAEGEQVETRPAMRPRVLVMVL